MKIYLRPLLKSEYPLTMAWRSNPDIFQGFVQQTAPLKWEEHIAWHKSRNRDWRNFIAMYNGRPIGVVTIGQLDHWSPEIGIIVGETSLWGKGIGTAMVEKAIAWIRNYAKNHKQIYACHTTILDNNKASIRIFEKCGFVYVDEARPGESWYKLEVIK